MERRRLGEMLVGDGVITGAQLAEALEAQKSENNLIGVILVKRGYIDDDILLEYLRLQGTIVKVKDRKH